MSREAQLWIFIDIETSGPVVGTHSMIELGAVVGSIKHGVLDRFHALLKPVGTALTSNPEAFLKAQEEGKPAGEVMQAFAAWCKPFEKFLAIFILRPAAYDWPWIVWYARTFLGNNPFGFRVVCAMSWYLAKGKKFELRLPPALLKAAELQLVDFLKEA
jgi:DNA polymerase III epsilon subunit-like protein